MVVKGEGAVEDSVCEDVEVAKWKGGRVRCEL